MVSEPRTTELVIRIRPRNGKDELSAEDVHKALCGREPAGQDRWIVKELEGKTLNEEALTIAVRECLQTIYASMAKELVAFIKECGKEWDSVKERVEPLLQGRFSQCPECGAQALNDTLNEGVKFICPRCEAKLVWKFIPDTNHPSGGRYTLTK